MQKDMSAYGLQSQIDKLRKQIKQLCCAAAGGGDNWRLLGNEGTNPDINFIGSIDDVPIVFKSNNVAVATFVEDEFVFNTVVRAAPFETDPSVSNEGDIYYNTTDGRFKGQVAGEYKKFLMEGDLSPIMATIARSAMEENIAFPGFYSDSVDATSFVAGAFYEFTGASQFNTSIILQCVELSPNPVAAKFSLVGNGKFLNADYQGVGNYDGVEDWSGIVWGGGEGQWIAADEGGYANDAGVIYNGLHYQVINGALFDGTYPKDDGSNGYILLAKTGDNLGYIEEWDHVEYDFANNWLQRRIDKRGNDVRDTYLNNIGSIQAFQWGNYNVIGNVVDQRSLFDCLNSAANAIHNNTVINQCVIDANFLNAIELVGCRFESAHTDLFDINQDYNGKTLTPYVSTFNVEVILITSGALSVPDYAGIIRIVNGNIGDSTCTGFDNTVTFPRKITVSAGSDTTITFDNSVDFVLPLPSTSVTLKTNDADFIEFLYNPITTAVDQIASEQYP